MPRCCLLLRGAVLAAVATFSQAISTTRQATGLHARHAHISGPPPPPPLLRDSLLGGPTPKGIWGRRFAALQATVALEGLNDTSAAGTRSTAGTRGAASDASSLKASLAGLLPACSARLATNFIEESVCLDEAGKPCMLCGYPLPSFLQYQHITRRTDCGGQLAGLRDLNKPLVQYNRPPSTNFLPPRDERTAWTNAWCELNTQVGCAQADAMRDYGYYSSTFVVPPDVTHDYYYCKYNGYLDAAVVEAATDYDKLYNMSEAFCAEADAEFNISSITLADFHKYYQPGVDPTPEMSRRMRAWTCAMGGPGGDINYCTYTYKSLGPTEFCLYPYAPGYAGTSFEHSAAAKAKTCSNQLPARPASQTLRHAV